MNFKNKYELDALVEYCGEIHAVWDYSTRYGVYTLTSENSYRTYEVKEEELKAVKTMSYEEMVEKVAKARYTMALSDSHEEVMKAQKTRKNCEIKARLQGFNMREFDNASRDLYLARVFKEGV